MGSSESHLDIADYCKLLGYVSAFVVQSVTLVRVLVGSKHRFLIKILGMLIAGNIALISDKVIFIIMLQSSDYSKINKQLSIDYGIVINQLHKF